MGLCYTQVNMQVLSPQNKSIIMLQKSLDQMILTDKMI